MFLKQRPKKVESCSIPRPEDIRNVSGESRGGGPKLLSKGCWILQGSALMASSGGSPHHQHQDKSFEFEIRDQTASNSATEKRSWNGKLKRLNSQVHFLIRDEMNPRCSVIAWGSYSQ